jgi:hypothetical protein
MSAAAESSRTESGIFPTLQCAGMMAKALVRDGPPAALGRIGGAHRLGWAPRQAWPRSQRGRQTIRGYIVEST